MSALINEKVPEHKILWIFVNVPKEKISTRTSRFFRFEVMSDFYFLYYYISFMANKNQEEKLSRSIHSKLHHNKSCVNSKLKPQIILWILCS